MDPDDHGGIYAERLEQSLQELRRLVQDREAALIELRASAANAPPRPPPGAAASLDTMKAAYDDVAGTPPFLPYPDSVLPALVALRKAHQTATETKLYLAPHSDLVDQAKAQLEVEQSNRRDQEALSQRLRERIQSLRSDQDNRMEMGPDDVARERIDELKGKSKHYDKEASKLLKALRQFIDQHLGPMLAAEELGGPVVGDLVGIEGNDLAAGFSAQGRLKKVKGNHGQDNRQRRIDEIWGDRKDQDHSPKTRTRADWDESVAAGAEMRRLTEELLNSLAKSDGDASTAYIQLAKETAAVRFLVRSRVAQFHPKDSTKLRLLDFGRELDD